MCRLADANVPIRKYANYEMPQPMYLDRYIGILAHYLFFQLETHHQPIILARQLIECL